MKLLFRQDPSQNKTGPLLLLLYAWSKDDSILITVQTY